MRYYLSFLFIVFFVSFSKAQNNFEILEAEESLCLSGIPSTLYFDDSLTSFRRIFFGKYQEEYNSMDWTIASYLYPTAEDAYRGSNEFPRDRIARNIPIEFRNPLILYARIEENLTASTRIKKVIKFTLKYSLPPGGRNNFNLYGCKVEDNIYEYNLHKVVDEMYGNHFIYDYSFYNSYLNASQKNSPIPFSSWSSFKPSANTEEIFIRVDYNKNYEYYNNCYSIYSIKLSKMNIDKYLIDNNPKYCGIPYTLDGPFDINNVFQFSNFEWYHNGILKSTTDSVLIDDIGEWTMFFDLNNACRDKFVYNIVWDDGKGVVSNVKKSGRNYIIESFKTKYPLEFSVDQINWQKSPTFRIVDDAKFSFYYKLRGCVFGPFEFYFNDIVDYFTPNGDGINDVWKINNTYLRDEYFIQIFDRFGKIVKDGPIKEVNLWDGKKNGFGLPTDTYWYIIKENDKQVMEGNVLLKNK